MLIHKTDITFTWGTLPRLLDCIPNPSTESAARGLFPKPICKLPARQRTGKRLGNPSAKNLCGQQHQAMPLLLIIRPILQLRQILCKRTNAVHPRRPRLSRRNQNGGAYVYFEA